MTRHTTRLEIGAASWCVLWLGLGCGLGEGLGVAFGSAPTGFTVLDRVAVVLASSGFVGAAGLLLAIAAGLVAMLPPWNGMARLSWWSALGWPQVAGAGTAGLVAVAACGLAAVGLGSSLVDQMTPPFVAAALGLITLVVLGVALLVAAPLGAVVTALAVRARSRLPGIDRHGIHWWFAALVVVLGTLVLGELVTRAWAWPAGKGLVVALLAVSPPGSALRRRLGGRGWILAAPVALLLATTAWLVFEGRPVAAGHLLQSGPYTGAVVGVVRSAFDRDGDGSSRVLAGGDCDDRNAAVHPGAEDVPDNGIDEDCSGQDAIAFKLPWAKPVPPPGSVPRGLSFVVVIVDALAWRYTDFEARSGRLTPQLVELAKRGVVFTQARSPGPETHSFLQAFFGGLYPAAFPIKRRGSARVYPRRAELLSERLKKGGYRNEMITYSCIMSQTKNLDQGFDAFDTPWPWKEYKKHRKPANRLQIARALEDVDRLAAGGDPFALFVHLRGPHDPYQPCERFPFGSGKLNAYKSAVAESDDEAAKLLRRVLDSELKDRTAVLLMADHGEEFGEHGFTHHGHTLHDTTMRVPLVVWAPGVKPRFEDASVSLLDLPPTMMDLARLHHRKAFHGRSLVGLLYGTKGFEPRPVFMENRKRKHEAIAVVDFPWKLIWNRKPTRFELYDVTADPDEQDDLAGERPELVGRLETLLEGWGAAVRSQRGGKTKTKMKAKVSGKAKAKGKRKSRKK